MPMRKGETGIDLEPIVSFTARMKSGEKDTKDRSEKALRRYLNYLVAHAQTKHLTGGTPLNVRTGRLRASVRVGPIKTYGKQLRGTVGTRVFYGLVWEFGAHIKAYFVQPKSGRTGKGGRSAALRFKAKGMGEGEWAYSKGHWIPAHDLKAKPWMAPSIRETKTFLFREFAKVGLGLV